ncbi:uncharacterized protein LOC118666062 isoform X4 [Myotis myotis]|uniref:uncharacterized protein LOC118666062 isoform X4 n=1 Tax=Myotis myotis TaxID=51298 RepID=UPI00174BE9E0|nr:uncharacterized protein LOC118666062 isoform X4 [Myotis myotis]
MLSDESEFKLFSSVYPRDISLSATQSGLCADSRRVSSRSRAVDGFLVHSLEGPQSSQLYAINSVSPAWKVLKAASSMQSSLCLQGLLAGHQEENKDSGKMWPLPS